MLKHGLEGPISLSGRKDENGRTVSVGWNRILNKQYCRAIVLQLKKINFKKFKIRVPWSLTLTTNQLHKPLALSMYSETPSRWLSQPSHCLDGWSNMAPPSFLHSVSPTALGTLWAVLCLCWTGDWRLQIGCPSPTCCWIGAEAVSQGLAARARLRDGNSWGRPQLWEAEIHRHETHWNRAGYLKGWEAQANYLQWCSLEVSMHIADN